MSPWKAGEARHREGGISHANRLLWSVTRFAHRRRYQLKMEGLGNGRNISKLNFLYLFLPSMLQPYKFHFSLDFSPNTESLPVMEHPLVLKTLCQPETSGHQAPEQQSSISLLIPILLPSFSAFLVGIEVAKVFFLLHKGLFADPKGCSCTLFLLDI